MSESWYQLKVSPNGADVLVSGRRYPFCSIESAIKAVASNNQEVFIETFRAYKEAQEN